jgi:hypothetical protein
MTNLRSLLPSSALRRGVAVVALAAPALVGFTARPAMASPTLLTCTFQGTFDVSPPVTLTSAPHAFTSHLTLTGCVGTGGTPRSGTATTTGTATGSCLAMAGHAQQDITWDDGTTSRAVGDFTNVLVLEPVVEQVVAGRYAGATGANVNVAYTSLDQGAGCVTGTGMSQAGFVGQLVILQ